MDVGCNQMRQNCNKKIRKKKLKKNIDYGKLTEKPAFNAKEQ